MNTFLYELDYSDAFYCPILADVRYYCVLMPSSLTSLQGRVDTWSSSDATGASTITAQENTLPDSQKHELERFGKSEYVAAAAAAGGYCSLPCLHYEHSLSIPLCRPRIDWRSWCERWRPIPYTKFRILLLPPPLPPPHVSPFLVSLFDDRVRHTNMMTLFVVG